jgi:hypothetical protein
MFDVVCIHVGLGTRCRYIEDAHCRVDKKPAFSASVQFTIKPGFPEIKSDLAPKSVHLIGGCKPKVHRKMA